MQPDNQVNVFNEQYPKVYFFKFEALEDLLDTVTEFDKKISKWEHDNPEYSSDYNMSIDSHKTLPYIFTIFIWKKS